MKVYLLLVTLMTSGCSLVSGALSGRQKQGIVFGGNGFLGSATLQHLLKKWNNITIINRGTPYWDSKSKLFPQVNHLQYDRYQKLSDFPRVERFLRQNYFDFVIDFSGTSKFAIEETTQALKNNVDVYILVSKDSVYEVCDYEKHSNIAVKETDAVRVDDPEEREELKESFSQSHRQLEAEEALVSQRQSGGIPYVILRPSDTIGPRDTKYKWVTYQLWTKVASVLNDVPLAVPEFLTEHNMSLVFVDDVATAIMKVLELKVRDEIINLAWKEFYQLDSVLETLAKTLKLRDLKVRVSRPDENVHYFYPGVTSLPLDVTKAESLINWSPTPFDQAVSETVQFYEDVMREDTFSQQRNEIIQHVVSHLYSADDKRKLKFYKALEDLYNINLHHFTRHHDEL